MIQDTETLRMVEELVGRANLAVMRTLNKAAEVIYDESQKFVPRDNPDKHTAHANRESGKYPRDTLAESGHVEAATPLGLTARVAYGGPYAAAQESGQMPYVGPEGTILWTKSPWTVEDYTTSGTKAHYLEDPAKMVIALLPEELGIQGRIAFEEVPGPIMSKSALTSTGHQVEAQPAPSGSIASVMRQEQSRSDAATTFQTPSYPPQLQ